MKTYGPFSANLRDKWNFFFLSLSLSLMFVYPSLFLLFPPSSFSFLFHFLIHPNFPSLICSPSHFFFIFHFLFSLLSHFLLSFFFSSLFLHFLFSISLFYYHQPNGPKVGETSPHFPPLPLAFFTDFLNFFFILFPSFSST